MSDHGRAPKPIDRLGSWRSGRTALACAFEKKLGLSVTCKNFSEANRGPTGLPVENGALRTHAPSAHLARKERTHMIGKITGQRLLLAKMHIANYVVSLENQAGAVAVDHIVRNINDEFKLVDSNHVGKLSQDVGALYEAIRTQQVASIDRGGYWKFRALSAIDAKNELARELSALGV